MLLRRMAEAKRVEKPGSPIAWDEALGAWAIWRHADVLAVLKDPRCSAAAGTLEHRPETLPAARDSAVARQHVAKGIVGRLGWAREQMLTVAEECCAGPKGRGSFDLQDDLILPCCLRLTLLLTGSSAEGDEARSLLDRAQEVFLLTNDGRSRQQADAAAGVLSRYLLKLITQRSGSPGEDFVSAFAQGGQPGHVVLAPALQMFVGLSTSLPLLLGSVMLELLSHPDQARRYMSEPARAVDELMRYAGPSQVVYRLSLEDAEIGGHAFERGDRLALLLAHANRDPAVFDDPDVLNVERAEVPHLSFGGGVHGCLGGPLVEDAVKLLPQAILSQFRGLTPDLDGVRWGGSKTVQGVIALPVRSG